MSEVRAVGPAAAASFPDPRPREVTWQAFRHFLHLDESNAAIHMAPVRYSPLTFRLAEVLYSCYPAFGSERDAAIALVLRDRGRYAEDVGR